MVTTSRSATCDLILVNKEIRRFSLIQAVDRICDLLTNKMPQLSKDEAYERIQFVANPSQGFAASDVECAELINDAQGQPKAIITLNLLALFGSSSPMPNYYNDYVSNSDSKNIQNFLDIFHHRIHRLIKTVWKKYRYSASFRTGASDTFSAQTFALLGLRDKELRENQHIDWARLLPYVGLLSQRVRSASAIEAVLRYYFQLPNIDIEQCTLRYSQIHPMQQNQLGLMSSTLGMDTVIGTSVEDRANKFRIHIRQLTWQQFHRFLAGEQDWKALHQLVPFVVKDPLDYDIQLHLKENEPRPLRIDSTNDCQLGWTSWLGSKPNERSITLSGKILC